MKLLRAFIALEIPAEIKKALDLDTAGLRQRAGGLVRWVSPENMHLTLKFLGETPQPRLDTLGRATQEICRRQAPFQVNVVGMGCFPNLRWPRVIWVGLEAPPDLSQLQARIEAAAAELGCPVEARAFSAHLTVGRVREQAAEADLKKLAAAVAELKDLNAGSFMAQSVTVFKSELRPAGPLYSSLFIAQLGI